MSESERERGKERVRKRERRGEGQSCKKNQRKTDYWLCGSRATILYLFFK